VTSLDDLGFLKGSIGETIVSTYSSDGQPNAAPMGVVIEGHERLLIRPYVSSLTYRNLQAKRCAVVNVTSNPEMFYLTAFKEANPDGKLSPELFEKAETVDAPRLRAADALRFQLLKHVLLALKEPSFCVMSSLSRHQRRRLKCIAGLSSQLLKPSYMQPELGRS